MPSTKMESYHYRFQVYCIENFLFLWYHDGCLTEGHTEAAMCIKWLQKINTRILKAIINLVNIGISSHNFKNQVANNVLIHGQKVPNRNIRSQRYIEVISKWTKNQQMVISEKKKTKSMIVHFTDFFNFIQDWSLMKPTSR